MRRPLCSLLGPLSAVLSFFFNDTATTEIYTLSLHDALPISSGPTCIFQLAANSSLLTRPRGRPRRGAVSLRGTRARDRKSTRLNSSHLVISYAVFCLKKKRRADSAPHRPEGRPRDTASPPSP